MKKWIKCYMCGNRCDWICTDEEQPQYKCRRCGAIFETDENGDPI
jgi:predicted nucleic acid-binding Zn ribbon protein